MGVMGVQGSSSDKATLQELQQPEKLKETLSREGSADCFSCKLIAAGAFGGLGIYTYLNGRRNLELQRRKIIASGSRFGMRSRQIGITGLSTMLVGMGLWRLIN